MMRFYLLLSISTLCLSLPIKEDTLDISNPPEFTTNTSETMSFPDPDVFISSLLPPSSISNCQASDYCNKGYCDQDGSFGPVFCVCFAPFVDSEEGLCATRGKSQDTATMISLWLGLPGGDWFYLSCGDPFFILIGLIKLAGSFIGALLMCYMSDWIHISFGSKMVNAGAFLGALFCYFMALTWWWIDFTRLSTGHWERDGCDNFLFIDSKWLQKGDEPSPSH